MTSPQNAAVKPLPLAGVKVIDFSRLLPGPFATMMLGELGADVVKVEQPGIGDPSRHNHPRYRQGSVYFHAANGNKRSIALDMATDAGKEVATRLLLPSCVSLFPARRRTRSAEPTDRHRAVAF